MGRRLVSDRFRDRRVFICGDAGHIWIPAAGYGMNAGIADAADLAWMIAGVLSGWAHPDILDACEAERQPITDQASRIVTDVALRVMKQRREVPPEIEESGPAGDAVRSKLGKEAHDLEVQQQCPAGLNFGYFYENSPIIAYMTTMHIPVIRCTNSRRPRCLAAEHLISGSPTAARSTMLSAHITR